MVLEAGLKKRKGKKDMAAESGWGEDWATFAKEGSDVRARGILPNEKEGGNVMRAEERFEASADATGVNRKLC